MNQSMLKRAVIVLTMGLSFACSAAANEVADIRRLHREVAAAAPARPGEILRMDDYNMAATVCPLDRLAQKSRTDFDRHGAVATRGAGRAAAAQ